MIPYVASPEPQIVTIESDSNKPTMLYRCGRQQPLIRPSHEYLNLLMKRFLLMTPISPELITEAQSHPPAIDDIPIQEEPVDVLYISTPSLMVSSINAWETSSDVGTSYSDKPQQISPASSPSSTPPPPRRLKRKMSLRKSLPKKSVAAQLRSLRWTSINKKDNLKVKTNSDFIANWTNFHEHFNYYTCILIRIIYGPSQWTDPN